MISRRVFLRNGSLALFATGLTPPFLLRTAAAARKGASRRPVLVSIFLRGGMDGLMAVPPLGGNELGRLRPNLVMPETMAADRVIDLGRDFGLHPVLQPLESLWRSRELAIVHAVGSPNPTRSHFDAQDYMERGAPHRKGMRSGWLNRTARKLDSPSTPLQIVAFGQAPPKAVRGPAPAVVIRDLSDLDLPENPLYPRIARLYAHSGDPRFQSAGRRTAEVIQSAVQAHETLQLNATDYPDTDLGRQLAQVAGLIRADVGLEIAACSSFGWDTHVRQGRAVGSFARAAGDLAGSLAAFWSDLGRDRDRVVVLTMTEFGRTAAENGSGGTDHGHGSCFFVLGRSLAGRKIHGTFPGLHHEQLFEGRDLAVTTDFRSVFAELAAGHMGVDSQAIFPGWKGPRLRLIRGA